MNATPQNVTQFLLDGKDPARIALQFLREDVTYGQLMGHVERISKSVLKMGGRKGDRVVLIGENSLFWVASYLGVIRAGLVCVPLAANTSAEDLEYILQVTASQIVFAQSQFVIRQQKKNWTVHLVTDADMPVLPGVLSQQSFASMDGDSTSSADFPSVDPDDLAALMFTSGSTGRPRGVMISHRNIIANTQSIIQCMGLTERDCVMVVLPFYYCFGTSLLHTHLRVGARAVVDMRFMYPETVLKRMIDTECTGFAGVPSHFQILLRNSSLSRKNFPMLRYVQQAGGHLSAVFLRELADVLKGKQVFVMYGQTEATARLSFLPPDLLTTKLGSVGKGMPGVQLQVLNESGDAVSPGEVGEIVARGENVAPGYWASSPEASGPFRNGFLYTGDLATVDDEGFIYIVDRASDFVKLGGERVSCRQIEEQLLACEELLEAAVIGVPHDVLGESIKAFIVPRVRDCSGITERVALFCRSRMSPSHVPTDFVVLAALPKNSAGKVLKSKLKML